MRKLLWAALNLKADIALSADNVNYALVVPNFDFSSSILYLFFISTPIYT